MKSGDHYQFDYFLIIESALDLDVSPPNAHFVVMSSSSGNPYWYWLQFSVVFQPLRYTDSFHTLFHCSTLTSLCSHLNRSGLQQILSPQTLLPQDEWMSGWDKAKTISVSSLLDFCCVVSCPSFSFFFFQSFEPHWFFAAALDSV